MTSITLSLNGNLKDQDGLLLKHQVKSAVHVREAFPPIRVNKPITNSERDKDWGMTFCEIKAFAHLKKEIFVHLFC